jgi:hypothetical protein
MVESTKMRSLSRLETAPRTRYTTAHAPRPNSKASGAKQWPRGEPSKPPHQRCRKRRREKKWFASWEIRTPALKEDQNLSLAP